jgi:ATP synthase protein I
MANDARDKDGREQPPADEAALTARLDRLGERLRHVRPDTASEQASSVGASAGATAMARGFRLSSELVAGVLVGAAIGWALDHWLGTSPWGMIVFLLLGFAAGVLNVTRAAGVLPTRTLGSRRSEPRGSQDGREETQ